MNKTREEIEYERLNLAINGFLMHLKFQTQVNIKDTYANIVYLRKDKGDFCNTRIIFANNKKLGSNVVIKLKNLFEPTNNREKNIRIATEAYILRTCLKEPHPNVVKILNVFLTPVNEIALEMESIFVNLTRVIEKQDGRLTPYQIKVTSQSVFKALAFLHSNKVVHCDVKLDNIMVTQDGTVKLIDFDSARIMSHHNADFAPDPNVNPRSYEPPEILLGQSFNSAVDIWAFACCLILMFDARKNPFSNGTNVQKLNAVNEFCLGGIPHPNLNNITSTNIGPMKAFSYITPKSLLYMITRMFSAHPVYRITANSALTYSYFCENQPMLNKANK